MLKIHKFVLRLKHLWCHWDDELVWSLLMKLFLTQLTLLRILGPLIRPRPRLGEWQLECRQAFMLHSQTGYDGSWISTMDFYSELVEYILDDALRRLWTLTYIN